MIAKKEPQPPEIRRCIHTADVLHLQIGRLKLLLQKANDLGLLVLLS